MLEQTVVLVQNVVVAMVQTIAVVVLHVVAAAVVLSSPIFVLLHSWNAHPSSYLGENHMLYNPCLPGQDIDQKYNTNL